MASFGAAPDVKPQDALFELLRSPDFYGKDSHLCEPLDESRLRVLKGTFKPRPLVDRLDGEALQLRRAFERTIERSEEELTRMADAEELPRVRPYLDPRLQHERATRVRFFASGPIAAAFAGR